jgi:hypothetical protein
MRFAIYIASAAIGVPLELMVIAGLLRGAYRKFPLVFVYSILNFLATVVEIPSTVAFYRGVAGAARTSADYWWNNEAVFQVLNYLVVMSLIYQATAELRSRRILRISLFAGAILFAGITFFVHYNPTLPLPGLWMTPWTRDLNFCSAILDLALWSLLIGRREKDARVLLLSGGMGVMFTGEAIGGSLREIALKDRSHALALSGGLIMMLSNLMFLFVWWQAFRPARQRNPKAGVAPLPRELPPASPEQRPPALQ